jgi:hypothetical protein
MARKGQVRIPVTERGNLMVLIPPETEQGPAMKALPNERWRAFVVACLNMGVGVNNTEAARIAGFHDNGDTDGALKVYAHHLAHDPRIQAAIQEEGRKRIRFGTIQATAVLMEAMSATKFDKIAGEVPDWTTRRGAAEAFLDRGGLHALSEHHVTVTNTKSREEKLLEVAKLAKMLGKDPKELLGNMADAMEGDFKTVKESGDGKEHDKSE